MTREPKPIFIKPATRKEGLARLLAASLYRHNPGMPFFETKLVDSEIENLERWVKASFVRPRISREQLKANTQARKKAAQQSPAGDNQEPAKTWAEVTLP